MRALGVTIHAPVCDVATNPTTCRSGSAFPMTPPVAELAAATIHGLKAAGVDRQALPRQRERWSTPPQLPLPIRPTPRLGGLVPFRRHSAGCRRPSPATTPPVAHRHDDLPTSLLAGVNGLLRRSSAFDGVAATDAST